MESDEIEDLPNRPLQESEVTSIEENAELDVLTSVYRLRENEDAVICIFGLTSDSSAFYVYNPREKRWERLFETELINDAYSNKAQNIQEQLEEESAKIEEYYDINEISFVKPDREELTGDNVLNDVLPLLPGEALSKDQLKEFRNEPEIRELIPHTYIEKTNNVVMFSISYEDGDTGNNVIALLRYTDEMNTWVNDGEVEHGNDENEETLETVIDEGYEALLEEYTERELGGFNTQKGIRDWWNNSM